MFTPQFLDNLKRKAKSFVDAEKAGLRDVGTFLGGSPEESRNTVLGRYNQQLSRTINKGVDKARAFFSPKEGSVRARDLIREGAQMIDPAQRGAASFLSATPGDVAQADKMRTLAKRFRENDPSLTPEERKLASQAAGDEASYIGGLTGAVGPASRGGNIFKQAVDSLRGPKPEVVEGVRVVPKKTGAVQSVLDFFTEDRKVLDRLGNAGKTLRKTVDRTYAQAEVQAGTAFNDVVRPLKKLDGKLKQNFVDVIEGKAQPLNAKVNELVEKYKVFRDSIADDADQLGLFQYGRRADYFPRIPKYEYLTDNKNTKTIIDHFIQTGQAEDNFAAAKMLDEIRQEAIERSLEGKSSLLRKAGNIEYSRSADLPVEAYETDPAKALASYFDKTYHRLNEAVSFGPKGEKLEDFYRSIADEGGDFAAAQKVMGRILDPKSPLLGEAQRAMLGYQSGSKLTTAFIANAAQGPVNESFLKGFGATGKAYLKFLTSPEEAVNTYLKSGSATTEIAQQISEGKYNKWVSRLPWMAAFGKGEGINRIIGANSSQFALEGLVKGVLKNPNWKTGRRLLEKIYNVNADEVIAKNGLQGDDLLRAINQGTNSSQFRTRSQDLPAALNNQDLKLLTQFKNFAYKQAQAFMEHGVKEAFQGNVTPLVRYLIAGAIVGEGVQDTKYGVQNAMAALTGQEKKERPTGLARVGENIMGSGGLGIYTDLVKRVNDGTYSLFSWVLGPTATELLQGASNTANAVQGEPGALGRQALKQIPYVGYNLGQDLFPSKSKSSSVQPGTDYRQSYRKGSSFKVNDYRKTYRSQ